MFFIYNHFYVSSKDYDCGSSSLYHPNTDSHKKKGRSSADTVPSWGYESLIEPRFNLERDVSAAKVHMRKVNYSYNNDGTAWKERQISGFSRPPLSLLH